MRLVAILLLLASPPAIAGEGQGDYDARMREGDTLEKQQKWTAALAAFEAALAARPGDARALTEIGWAAVHAGKPDRARTASEAALQSAGDDPSLRGAALFNYGLALEREDPWAAASLVLASYRLRPNGVVEKKLVELERDPRVRTPSARKSLLARVAVAPLPVPRRGKSFPRPVDAALWAALEDAGVEGEGATGKWVLLVDGLTCAERDGKAECANPVASGPKARALVVNLKHRKLPPTDGAWRLDVRCVSYTDEPTADSCELTPPQ